MGVVAFAGEAGSLMDAQLLAGMVEDLQAREEMRRGEIEQLRLERDKLGRRVMSAEPEAQRVRALEGEVQRLQIAEKVARDGEAKRRAELREQRIENQRLRTLLEEHGIAGADAPREDREDRERTGG